MTDPDADNRAARIIADFCFLKGWSDRWGDLSPDQQAEFLGVVETFRP